MMTGFKKKYLGDRAFYRTLLVLAVPLIIQQGITSFVNLIDNVMVGGLGTESISAVAIVNQILMVFNLAIFGGLSGASIFGAQFFGKNDHDGVRNTFRFRLIFGSIVTSCAIMLFVFFGKNFISLFLTGDSGGGDLVLTMNEAADYMKIMLIGLIPFMLVQCYTGVLRESGETVVPMVGSVAAILINLCLNYCLIFGNFGFPGMGVRGAALATIISRFAEALIIIGYASLRTDRYPFIKGTWKSFSIPSELVKKIVKIGTPLFFNEFLWSLGITTISQCYSTRGLSSVAAVNIAMTVSNIFAVVMMASGSAISILVGQKLGTGDREGAIDLDRKLIFTVFACYVVIAAALFSVSGLIPKLYNVTEDVRALSTLLLKIESLAFPINAVVNGIYFTIRSGGKTVITFLFDSCYTWAVPVSLAFVLSRFTLQPIEVIYFAVKFIDIIKLTVGLLMLRTGFWANDIVR